MRRGGPNIWFVIAMILVVAAVLVMIQGPQRSTISYDFFMTQLEKTEPCNILVVELGDIDATGVFRQPPDVPPGVAAGRHPTADARQPGQAPEAEEVLSGHAA